MMNRFIPPIDNMINEYVMPSIGNVKINFMTTMLQAQLNQSQRLRKKFSKAKKMYTRFKNQLKSENKRTNVEVNEVVQQFHSSKATYLGYFQEQPNHLRQCRVLLRKLRTRLNKDSNEEFVQANLSRIDSILNRNRNRSAIPV